VEFGYQIMKQWFNEGTAGALVKGMGFCSMLVGYPGPSNNYFRA